jgi:uncharacterized membrane protein
MAMSTEPAFADAVTRAVSRLATAIADAILFTLSHFDLSRRPSRHSGIGSSLSYLLVVIIKGFQLYFGSRCDQRRAAFPQHAADCMVKP